jgi:hypothetical protein
MRWLWFLVLTLIFTLGLIVGNPPPAPCDINMCFGGMCMDSSACAPGCSCIGGRCG